MQCPKCSSTKFKKNGIKKGKQKYICLNCKRQFLDSYVEQKGYSAELKRECLTMYLNGMGLRSIARAKKVHHTTIITWVKKIAELLPDAYEDRNNSPQAGEVQNV